MAGYATQCAISENPILIFYQAHLNVNHFTKNPHSDRDRANKSASWRPSPGHSVYTRRAAASDEQLYARKFR